MANLGAPSKLSLTASLADARDAVLAALPKDAVVRAEDDGVGRFAGHRTVAIIARNEKRLMLFEGTWGSLKPRLEEPQVEVTFDEDEEGAIASLRREAAQPQGGGGAFIGDLLNRGLTVAVVMVAYFWIKSEPIDVQLTVTVSVLGGLAWTAVAFLLPQKEDQGLEGRVRKALEPLLRDDDDDDDDDASDDASDASDDDDDDASDASDDDDASDASDDDGASDEASDASDGDDDAAASKASDDGDSNATDETADASGDDDSDETADASGDDPDDAADASGDDDASDETADASGDDPDDAAADDTKDKAD